jgi:hypothetical protein
VKKFCILMPAIISAVIMVSCNDFFDDMNKQANLNKGLVAYWPIVGNSFYQKDYSGNGNNLNTTNMVSPISQSGKFSTALVFATASEYMIYNGSIGAGIPSGNEMSFCAWVSNGSNQTVISGSSFSFVINGVYSMLFAVGGSSPAVSPLFPTDYSWQYVSGTYDGNNVRLYLNGELASSVPYSGGSLSTTAITLGNGFSGYLDEIRIYNRVLNQDEIKELMNMGVE